MNRRYVESPPDPRPSSATTLRIYGHPGSRDVGDPGSVPRGPEVARCRIDGMPCLLVHWSAEEWARVPDSQRPRDAFPGSRGGWYAFAVAD